MAWSGWIGHTGQVLGAPDAERQIQGSPAAVRRHPDFVNVYARTADNRLKQYQWRRGQGWTWWDVHSGGGRISSSPAAGSLDPDQEHVLARGMDNRLWWKEWTRDRNWSGWEQLGGTTTFQGAPAVVSRNRDVINVYARSDDNRLLQIAWERGRGWQPAWLPHAGGGVISSSPSAASLGPDHEAVFARGTDNRLWWREWTRDGNWSRWQQLGGSTTFRDSPAAVSRNRDLIHVYARGDDDSVIQLVWERNRGWRPAWEAHTDGGRVSAAPAPAVIDENGEFLFVRGMDGSLWHKWIDRDGVLTMPLHLKYAPPPSSFSFTTQAVTDALQLVFSGALVWAPVRSVEQLNDPLILDINSGACVNWGPATTFNSSQQRLFSNRNSAGPDDIVVYFVRTASGWAGCAVHPEDRPGALVTQVAGQWVAAHEVGHVLGRGHERSTDHIMFESDEFTNAPPDLSVAQVGPGRHIRRA